jgi:GNAT superfamily N-acetyltransferase
VPLGRSDLPNRTLEETALEIRPPTLSEWPACRMLLPEAFTGAAPEGLIAVDPAARQIAGAAVFRYGRTEILGARLRVVQGYRRRGIGTRFLERISTLGAERGLNEVYAWSDLAAETDAEEFLKANGFRRHNLLQNVEGDLLLLRDYLRRIRDRLVKSGKIPADAAIMSLEPAHHQQVAKMYAEYIAQARDFHPSQILPALGSGRLSASSVLIINGAVEGILLADIEEGKNLATVHARVVSPRYRGGWANCLLMLRSLELGLDAGSQRVRFDVPGNNSDTRKLMARCNAVVKRVMCWFVRDLRAPEGGRHATAT